MFWKSSTATEEDSSGHVVTATFSKILPRDREDPARKIGVHIATEFCIMILKQYVFADESSCEDEVVL